MTINYKAAEKMLEEKEENDKLLAEAKEKREKEIYKNSFHHEVEKLMSLVCKLGEHVGRRSKLKLATVKISYHDYGGVHYIDVDSIERKQHGRFFNWSEPVWEKRIVWLDDKYDKDKSSSFRWRWNQKGREKELERVDALTLFELVRKEVFDYIASKVELQVLEELEFHCHSCNLKFKQETGDKFCPNCGNKTVIE